VILARSLHKLEVIEQECTKSNESLSLSLFGRLPRIRGLRRMVQRLHCVVVHVRVRLITHGGDELAPPILAAYYVLY